LIKAIYARFERNTHFLGRLTKLHYIDIVENFIVAFEQLFICTKGMIDSFFKECFLNGLKEEIRAQFLMAHLTTWLEASQWIGVNVN
jgi:hypothetical protein